MGEFLDLSVVWGTCCNTSSDFDDMLGELWIFIAERIEPLLSVLCSYCSWIDVIEPRLLVRLLLWRRTDVGMAVTVGGLR